MTSSVFLSEFKGIGFSQWGPLLLISSFLAMVPFGQLSQGPMALMAVSGLVLLFKQGRSLWERPEIRLFSLIFLAFWLPIVFSLIGAVNPVKTFTVSLIFLRFFPAGVFIIYTLAKSGAPAKLLCLNAWILLLWIGYALLQAGWEAVVQGVKSNGSITSFFRTGSDLGMVLSIFCPFLLVHIRRNWHVVLQLICVNLLVAVVFMAGGRGGWICLAVALTGYGAWMVYRNRKSIIVLGIAALLLVLTLIGTLHFSQEASERIKKSLLVFSNETELIDTALSFRLPIWQTAVSVFQQYPVNGVGARNFRYVYADFAPSNGYFTRKGRTANYAHTLILDIGTETGIIGLTGLLLALWLLFNTWLQADLPRRRVMLPYAVALAAMFFPLNTHYATYSSAWSAACFWLLALFCAVSGKKGEERSGKTMLWWGRFDPDYSRNRLFRSLLVQLGWRVKDFCPRVSFFGHIEAVLKGVSKPDIVWVPNFRHRDLLPARQWSSRHKIPLVFDPLISDYDKQVFERGKFAENSFRARRVLARERRLVKAVDLLLADTDEHARFYRDVLKADPRRLFVLPVGAEEDLFYPEKSAPKSTFCRESNDPPEVLFYGSFIPLQGPQFIADAIGCYHGPPVRWTFLGNGPLLARCQKMTAGLPNVFYENWRPYLQLPSRIRQADILLGIFGDTPKTRRVIPNKVFQSMACGRPVITAATPAYPRDLLKSCDSGIMWVEPANPMQLADAVACLAGDPGKLCRKGSQAYESFRQYFASAQLQDKLERILAELSTTREG